MVFAKTFESLDRCTDRENQDMIYVFYADLNDNEMEQYLEDDFNMEISLRMLPLNTQVKIRNKKHKKDQIVSLVSALMVKYVASCFESSEKTWDQLVISLSDYGKPFFANRGYTFNLSDEKGVVALAIQFKRDQEKSELGLDLANPEDIARFATSASESFYRSSFRDMFSESEVDELDRLFLSVKSEEERVKLLSQYWALKESYSKYKGVGLRYGLKDYVFCGVRPLDGIGVPETSQKSVTNGTAISALDAPPFSLEGAQWNCSDVCCSDREVSTLRCFLNSSELVCCVVTEKKVVSRQQAPTLVRVNPMYIVEFTKEIQIQS